MLSKLKKIANNCLKYCIKKMGGVDRFNTFRLLMSLSKRDHKITAKHNDWQELTRQEKNSFCIYKSDVYQMKAFKNICGELRYGFISDAVYQLLILPKLHPMDYMFKRELTTSNVFFDKNYMKFFLKNLRMPKTVLCNVENEFLTPDYTICTDPLSVLNNYDYLVFKKSLGSGHGSGVTLVSKGNYEAMMNTLQRDYIIQEQLKQSTFFQKWNSTSVNIVRITTLFWKSEIYVLGGILRIGAPGEFCDHTTSQAGEHPRVIGLFEDGSLMSTVIDPDTATKYDNIWGKKPEGKVPKYEEMKHLVIEEHERFPHHKIIGWDLTIDDSEQIVCIEYNAYVPGIIQNQYCLGPIFSQRTRNGDTILKELMA